MKINLYYVLAILLILSSFIIGLVCYSSMPELMITHWDSSGIPNGYSSKLVGLFLTPIISLILFIFFLFMPKFDPINKDFKHSKDFKKFYDIFIILILFFLFYINILSILNNLGYLINMTLFIIPALSLLLYNLGIIIGKSKQNWFMGVRTPWTLSNKDVWDKTNKLASKLFKLNAIIILIGVFFIKYLFYFIIIPVILNLIIMYIYSYLIYVKLNKK